MWSVCPVMFFVTSCICLLLFISSRFLYVSCVNHHSSCSPFVFFSDFLHSFPFPCFLVSVLMICLVYQFPCQFCITLPSFSLFLCRYYYLVFTSFHFFALVFFYSIIPSRFWLFIMPSALISLSLLFVHLFFRNFLYCPSSCLSLKFVIAIRSLFSPSSCVLVLLPSTISFHHDVGKLITWTLGKVLKTRFLCFLVDVATKLHKARWIRCFSIFYFTQGKAS